MAILVRSDGFSQTIRPKSGGAFTLEELQQQVGGYVELVRLSPAHFADVVLVDEEGLMKGLPYNHVATLHAGRAIVGHALFLSREELGD